MKKLAFVLCFISTVASAQVGNLINFRGQNGESLNISQMINSSRTETYEVPATCTHEVARDVEECGTVSRDRYECYPGPDRQVCVDVPQREVCVERPTREVCRTDSRGQQRCQTVGGGQSCHWVGGGQTCRTESGPEVCRTVTDQEYVCNTVTRYETEEYDCSRTETRVVNIQKELKGRVNVNFVTNGVVEEFPLEINLAPKDANYQEFLLMPILRRQPRVLVAAQKRRVRVIQETEEQIIIDGEITIETLDVTSMNISFPTALKTSTITKDTYIVNMNIEGALPGIGKLELELFQAVGPGKDIKLGEIKGIYPSDKINIVGNKFEINMAGLVTKLAPNMVINVKVGSDTLKGEILNTDRSKIEKVFNRLTIKQL